MEVQNLMVLNLADKEAQTLKGILLVEQEDLKDLIEDCDNTKDKNELEEELRRVESILNKFE